MANVTTDLAAQEEEKNVAQVKADGEVKDKIIKDNLSDPEQDALDKYVKTILTSYARPAEADAMINKDTFVDTYTDMYLDKYAGNKSKAKRAMDEEYELISKRFQEHAGQESNMRMIENLEFLAHGVEDIDFIGDEYAPMIYVTPETISGRKQILDTWTDPTRSIAEVSLMNKKVVDYDGNIIEYDEDAYDELALNDDYANKDGKNIIAFTYLPYSEYQRDPNVAIKAVYEGEIPDGEIVSRWDTSDSFLRGNGLDTSTWKVGVGSIFDFVTDTVDTALALTQYTALQFTAGLIGETEIYKSLKDLRTIIGTGMTSKSTKDKESLLTFNNALSMGINIVGQLLTGKAIAKGMAKLVGVGIKTSEAIFKTSQALNKARAIEGVALSSAEKIIATRNVKRFEKLFSLQKKIYNRKSNIVKGTTLMALGAMQAKATGDEAALLGFSHREQALIFFASLGSMMVANNLSDLGFDRIGLKAINPILKRAVKTETIGITPQAGGILKLFKKTEDITSKTRFNLAVALSKKSIIAGGLREGMQEETEYVFDELVRHSATALSALGYGAEGPQFKTMMDEGYWEEAAIESLMNFTVGALAGAGTSAVTGDFKVKKTEGSILPSIGSQSENTTEVFKHVGFYATRTSAGVNLENQLYRHLKKVRKKVD